MDLLEDIQCHYYDGAILVEIVDFIFSQSHPPSHKLLLKVFPLPSSFPLPFPPSPPLIPPSSCLLFPPSFPCSHPSPSPPLPLLFIKLILRKMQNKKGSQDSVMYELEKGLSKIKEVSSDDLINSEKLYLNTVRKPICLDPSIEVCLISNTLQGNNSKYQKFTSKMSFCKKEEGKMYSHPVFDDYVQNLVQKLEKPTLNTPLKYIPPIGSLPAPSEPFSLFNLLKSSKIGGPDPDPFHPGHDNKLNLSGNAAEMVKNVPAPNVLELINQGTVNYDGNTALTLQKTTMRYTRANGRKYIYFELDKAEGLGYTALLRMGNAVPPDSAAVTRFLSQFAFLFPSLIV